MVELLNDRGRLSTLLQQYAQGPELEAIHERQRELNESLLTLDAALRPPPGRPRMPLDRYWAQVEEVERERDELNRRLAVTREAALIGEAMKEEWTLALWDSKPLSWRRTMLSLSCKRLALEPRGKITARDAYGRNVFDPERVKVEFSA
jgi:hypothetical protein